MKFVRLADIFQFEIDKAAPPCWIHVSYISFLFVYAPKLRAHGGNTTLLVPLRGPPRQARGSKSRSQLGWKFSNWYIAKVDTLKLVNFKVRFFFAIRLLELHQVNKLYGLFLPK
jgi:hypothetical protein